MDAQLSQTKLLLFEINKNKQTAQTLFSEFENNFLS